MAAYQIREGCQEEIQCFPLWDAANAGENILVAVNADEVVVGYVQFTANQIYFLESAAPGAGTALVMALKAQCDELDAINCIPTAQAFWAKMGFEPIKRPAFAMRQVGIDMRWFHE